MEIKLSDHFTYKKLFQFVIPSIAMMVFISIYGVVDGYFVSNYAGKTAFAAVNLILPFSMMIGTFGFMIGTGGSAIVSKALGEQKQDLANEYFSFFVKVTLIIGTIVSVIAFLFTKQVAIWFGADAGMLPYCVLYGRIVVLSVPSFMLQNIFQNFMVVAGKPNLGFKITVLSGVSNMILDWLLVGVLSFGVAGAASASFTSQIIGGVIPLLYFMHDNDSSLRIVSSKWNGSILLKACTNGASELMTNLSLNIVAILYNFQLIRFAQENGVAAYGVIMYVNFIFISTFIGYSMGTAPIVGYNYGAKNHEEMHNIFKKSLTIMIFMGLSMFVIAFVLSSSLSQLFVGYDMDLFEMTKHAFRIYSISFIVTGINIYASSFFTALGNGAVSAGLSFFRTLLFQIGSVLILPMLFGLNGIWYAVILAELLGLIMSAFFFFRMKPKYNY